MNTILQVPIDKTLRNQAAAAASNLGFSSLQEAVRVFLAQLPTQTVKISFEEPAIKLSPKAIKRYNKMIDEVESGKVETVSFTDVDKMMEYLHSK
ncbi:MAG: hypothetical protein UX92_C0009G0025 [Candidatus Amesbacteria bacterium GW2011_GWA1_47_20]|uniref:Uncharacterized protein n=2 Tax=Candidatus Amesiibacteriota TaxID=1752730 RepID=A0A0G1VID1_9BACT|nr:MAG: hypothetical protein UX92_C0009G0025 [Candidatus Amesbacteria bacterium GW2011_GWA1_47_20]KKU84012.1 MAG: hypothetical protein UY11_C0008G0025 [Candidatus Amesbacteria bacterium GW2011_GWC2_47_8]